MILLKRIKKLLFFLYLSMLWGEKRAIYLKKKSYLGSQGENCYFGIYNFGTEPWMIYLGNNVVIATGVRFINHDMSAEMLSQYLYGTSKKLSKYGEIKVGNNVFIGADSIILPNVEIGDNVIVGAGSIISKNLDSNGVYVGNGKSIMTFNEYLEKTLNYIKDSNPKYFRKYHNFFQLKDDYLYKALR